MGAAFSWSFKENREIDTANILDKLIFQDSENRIGAWLIDAGQVSDSIYISNSSVLNTAMVCEMKQDPPENWKPETLIFKNSKLQ